MALPALEFHHTEKGGVNGRLEGPPRCDFCGTAAPVYTLLAREFDIDLPDPERPGYVYRMHYGARWASCSACKELIAAENWTALLDAAVHAYAVWGVPVPDHTRAALRAEFAHVHGLFRIHRLPLQPLLFVAEE